jgi:hypothetical protein
VDYFPDIVQLNISSFSFPSVSVEEDEVGGTCGTNGGEEECV